MEEVPTARYSGWKNENAPSTAVCPTIHAISRSPTTRAMSLGT